MRLEFESNSSTTSFTEINSLSTAAGSSEIGDALRQGIEAAQAGNRSQARALLLRVTETEPRSEDAWLWLASVSEYPEELVIFLNNALDVNPGNERAIQWMKETKSLLAKTFVERGVDAAGENRLDFARQCFYQAAAHDAQSETAWLRLASIADTSEQKQTHLARVLAINPENRDAQAALKTERDQTAQTLLRQASQQALTGERASALAALTEILRQSPQFEDALILKAHLTDDFAEKIKYFESVMEINPANEAARAGLNSLHALRNFAAPIETEETSQNLAVEKDVLEQSEVEAENGFEDFAADENATAEFKMEKAVDEKAADTGFAFSSVSSDVENEKQESGFFFGETSFEENTAIAENVDFGEISFDSLDSEDRNELELSEDVFEFDAATNDLQSESFALNELEEDVFAPDETAGVSNFSLPTVDFTSTEELSASEFKQNDFSESNAPDQSSLDEETDVLRADEFYAEITEPVADVLHQTAHTPARLTENSFVCPFCNAENDVQSYACGTCRAVLSLSELEMLLANGNADRETLERAVERMEEERNFGDFGEYELMSLGIGHVNLKNLRRGLSFLQQASKSNPNNVVLSSQVNALALRLEEIERREENSDAPTQPRTILVVDDSATVRKLISGKLEKSGHEVVCAVDGMDALAKLSEAAPDLILLDITMPRMDGYQVCKMIRGNPLTKNIPVVMISGKDGFFDKVRGRIAGTTGYITKPFGPETLMKALDVYIRNTHEQIVSAEV